MESGHLTRGALGALVALASPAELIRRGLAYTTLLLLACIWSQGCTTVHVHSPSDAVFVSEVKQVMHRYLAAFNAVDYETIGLPGIHRVGSRRASR